MKLQSSLVVLVILGFTPLCGWSSAETLSNDTEATDALKDDDETAYANEQQSNPSDEDAFGLDIPAPIAIVPAIDIVKRKLILMGPPIHSPKLSGPLNVPKEDIPKGRVEPDPRQPLCECKTPICDCEEILKNIKINVPRKE